MIGYALAALLYALGAALIARAVEKGAEYKTATVILWPVVVIVFLIKRK